MGDVDVQRLQNRQLDGDATRLLLLLLLAAFPGGSPILRVLHAAALLLLVARLGRDGDGLERRFPLEGALVEIPSPECNGGGEVQVALLQPLPLLRVLLPHAEIRPQQRHIGNGHTQGVVDEAEVQVVQADEDLGHRARQRLLLVGFKRRGRSRHSRRCRLKRRRRKGRPVLPVMLLEESPSPCLLLGACQLERYCPLAPGLELEGQAARHLS